PDPRVASERRLATRLRRLGARQLRVYDPTRSPALERYLERNLAAEARPGLPERDAMLDRALERGTRLVVLDGGIAPRDRDRVTQASPEAIFVPAPAVTARGGRLP